MASMGGAPNTFADGPGHSAAAAPPQRKKPEPLRLDHLGMNPSSIVGKVLKSVRRSPKHPALTLYFVDGTRAQILVEAYNPSHPGVPKTLEMDSLLNELLNTRESDSLDLTVKDCAFITLSDKAFALHSSAQWDQRHLGLAFKFASALQPGPDSDAPDVRVGGWHCVWATLQDHDDSTGECVFRTYDDVYLEDLQRSPRKQRTRRTRSGSSPIAVP